METSPASSITTDPDETASINLSPGMAADRKRAGKPLHLRLHCGQMQGRLPAQPTKEKVARRPPKMGIFRPQTRSTPWKKWLVGDVLFAATGVTDGKKHAAGRTFHSATPSLPTPSLMLHYVTDLLRPEIKARIRSDQVRLA